MISIDKILITDLLNQASKNPRLRQNYDLRNSSDDNSQRMLNALQPGTNVPIHRHPNSNEIIMLVCGKVIEILYEEVDMISYTDVSEINGADTVESDSDSKLSCKSSEIIVGTRRFKEVGRYHMDPEVCNFGCVVPAGVWHTIEVIEPSVIYETKDGRFGEDGSEVA